MRPDLLQNWLICIIWFPVSLGHLFGSLSYLGKFVQSLFLKLALLKKFIVIAILLKHFLLTKTPSLHFCLLKFYSCSAGTMIALKFSQCAIKASSPFFLFCLPCPPLATSTHPPSSGPRHTAICIHGSYVNALWPVLSPSSILSPSSTLHLNAYGTLSYHVIGYLPYFPLQ